LLHAAAVLQFAQLYLHGWVVYYLPQISRKVWLNKGQKYYTEILHTEHRGRATFNVAVRIHAAPAANGFAAGSAGAAEAAGGGWISNSDQQMLASPREVQRVLVKSKLVRELQVIRVAGVRGRFRVKSTWVQADGSTATKVSRHFNFNQHPRTIQRELVRMSACRRIRVYRRWVWQRIKFTRRNRVFYRRRRAGFEYHVNYMCAPVSDEQGHATLEIVESTLTPRGHFTADVSVKKVRAASPAVRGEFRLNFRGEWTEFLPFHANWRQVKKALESLSTVQPLQFVKDDRTPADARRYRIGFTQAGDMPTITADSSRLQGATIVVDTPHQGSIDGFFDPIPADLFEIAESTPGIQVFTNGIQASCPSPTSAAFASDAGSSKVSPMPEFYQLMDPTDEKCENCVLPVSPLKDAPADVVAEAASASDVCAFAFDAALSPTLSSVSPATVGVGASLTVTGAGFLSTNPADNTVLLRPSGSSDDASTSICTVTAATSNQLTCTVGHSVAGSLDVIVIVAAGRGQARGSAVVQYQGRLESVSPAVGSIAGGTLVTLSGTGFPSSLETSTGFTVRIGSGVCSLESSSFTTATCRTPALGSAAASADDVACEGMTYSALQAAGFTGASLLASNARCTASWSVSAASISTADTVSDFAFAASHTPSVTAVSPSDVSAAATTAITLQGSLLGKGVSVSFGDVPCDTQQSPEGVEDVADQITCVIPRGVGLCGRGDHTTAHTLNPELVAGEEGHHRRLSEAQARHHRRLSGGDEACEVSAETHSSSPSLVVPGYGAAMVVGATTLSHGFHVTSVSPSTGSLAGGSTISATGSFFVASRADDHTARVTFTVPNGADKTVECHVTAVTSTSLQCVLAATPAGFASSGASMSGVFQVMLGGYVSVCDANADCMFTLTPTATPRVASASVSHAEAPSTFDAATFSVAPSVLTLSMPGLSAEDDAATTVTVGGNACPRTPSAAGTVACSVAHDRAGVVDVVVATPTGFAAPGADASALRYEHPLRVDAVAPLAGSMAGGRRVTVFGVGLAATGAGGALPQVWLGNPATTVEVPGASGPSVESLGVQAVVESATPTMLVVRAPAFPTALTPVAAQLEADGAAVVIDVSAQGGDNAFTRVTDFHFKWQADLTPIISAVAPQQGSAGDVITLTGTGLAGADVSVTIGGVPCTGATVTVGDGEESVQCTLGDVPGGNHADIVVDVAGKGYASFDLTNGRRLTAASDESGFAFASNLEVTSISNSEGGVAGGWELQINGRGFPSNPEDASVLVCGHQCATTSSSYSRLTCTVPSLRSAASMAKFSSVYSYGRGDDFITSSPGRDIRQKLTGDVRSKRKNFQPLFDGDTHTGATTGNRCVGVWCLRVNLGTVAGCALSSALTYVLSTMPGAALPLSTLVLAVRVWCTAFVTTLTRRGGPTRCAVPCSKALSTGVPSPHLQRFRRSPSLVGTPSTWMLRMSQRPTAICVTVLAAAGVPRARLSTLA